MAQQDYKDSAVELYATHFPKRNEPNFAWGNVNGIHQQIPYLRGFWNFAVRNEVPQFYDQSGNGRTLSNINGDPTPLSGLAPYVDILGAGGIRRADEAGLRMGGYFSLGGWYYFHAFTCVMIGKWNTVGNNRSFSLWVDAAGVPQFSVSSLGTAASDTTLSHTTTLTLHTWHHICGVLWANTAMNIYVDGVEVQLGAGFPATAFAASTAAFEIGGIDTSTASLMTGRAGYNWLAAATLPSYFIKSLYELSRPLFGV